LFPSFARYEIDGIFYFDEVFWFQHPGRIIMPHVLMPPFRLIEKVAPKDQGCREAAKNALTRRKKNKFWHYCITRQL
jgi:hypothetical protein